MEAIDGFVDKYRAKVTENQRLRACLKALKHVDEENFDGCDVQAAD